MKRLQITDQELTAALKRMAPEAGSLICLGCGHEHSCSIHGCAVLRAAADRLTALSAQPPNEPLTLEELREMDGEPVWVERPGYGKRWALVQVWAKSTNVIYITYNNGSTSLVQVELDCGGRAYRRKPKEVQYEAD